MFMLIGSFVTSGTLPVVGAALPFSAAGVVLGAALLVAVLILITIRDAGEADRLRRPARSSRRATTSRWNPLGHGRSA